MEFEPTCAVTTHMMSRLTAQTAMNPASGMDLAPTMRMSRPAKKNAGTTPTADAAIMPTIRRGPPTGKCASRPGSIAPSVMPTSSGTAIHSSRDTENNNSASARSAKALKAATAI